MKKEADADFIRRLLQGDPEAEREFCTRFSALVCGKAVNGGFSPEDAEEISQETLFRALESIRKKGGLQAPEQLGAYVHATAKNVIAQFWREQLKHSDPPPAVASAGNQSQSEACSPELGLWNGDFRRECLKVLKAVRPRYREILSDYYIKEMGRKALCRKWGITPGHCRVLLHRALSAFAKKAEELGVLGELLEMMHARPD